VDELQYIHNAKQAMTVCKMCKECNGEVCRGLTPGPGGKGQGHTFVRNVAAFKQVKLHMRVIGENVEPDTTFQGFGSSYAAPIFAAPISNVKVNYGSLVDEETYLKGLVDGMRQSQLLAFLGDAPALSTFNLSCAAMHENPMHTIMTVKPWEHNALKQRLQVVLDAHPMAVAMDIDAGGLVSLRSTDPRVSILSVEDLKAVKAQLGSVPLILKGIMTLSDAKLALDAGADGLIVSNHGGRVMDDGLATLEVLEEIIAVVNDRCPVWLDGGVRTGSDVFKALALGAKAVLVGRPYSHASLGSGAEGVQHLSQKLIRELKDAMRMTQCATLADITRDKVRWISSIK
jgi:isopentenyl diphosphate isomerase/L-lactate dehydrogenase-like FMN-dependent dehydrogenase